MIQLLLHVVGFDRASHMSLCVQLLQWQYSVGPTAVVVVKKQSQASRCGGREGFREANHEMVDHTANTATSRFGSRRRPVMRWLAVLWIWWPVGWTRDISGWTATGEGNRSSAGSACPVLLRLGGVHNYWSTPVHTDTTGPFIPKMGPDMD